MTGDIQTENDAIRLRRYGYPGAPDHHRRRLPSGCAHGAKTHVGDWLERGLELLLIENVGNLVCPTSYDLGRGRQEWWS